MVPSSSIQPPVMVMTNAYVLRVTLPTCWRQRSKASRCQVVIAMTLTNRAEALFTSPLQPSDRPSSDQIRAAIAASVRSHRGISGCAAVLAAEYGDHPEAAAGRMRWALGLAAAA